jgi:hypothetical protein
MVQIIKRTGVRRRSDRRGWVSQEPGGAPKPDIKRPPDSDIPEFDSDEIESDVDDRPGAPPFTGEDVERRKPDQPGTM